VFDREKARRYVVSYLLRSKGVTVLALPEVCGVWIEQRIQEAREEGKSLKAIGREVAKEVEQYFEVEVNPETIRSKARRIGGGSNDHPQPTDQDHSEKGGSGGSQIKPKEAAKMMESVIREKGVSIREASRMIAESTGLTDESVKGAYYRRKKKKEGSSKPKKKTVGENSPTEPTNQDHSDPGLTSQTAAEQPGDSDKWDGKIRLVTYAMQYVEMAIGQLERIRDDDPKKEEALLYVAEWIRKQLGGLK
jgi:hypothetical protein